MFNSCSVLIPFKNLPKPDGNYSIGTDVFIMEDKNRSEFFTDDTSVYRKDIKVEYYYDPYKDMNVYLKKLNEN